MRNDLPIQIWRTRVRRLFRRGNSPKDIARKLDCSIELVRLQLRVWGVLENREGELSHAATNWAIKQRGLKPATKIVLWHLCDRHNPDHGCFPMQSRLAEDCEMSRSTLNLHLAKLEEMGLIRRFQSVDPETKRQLPTRYELAFESDEKTVSENKTRGQKAVSEKHQKPCPKNGGSRVLKSDTNSVREPLREPVREKEDTDVSSKKTTSPDLFSADAEPQNTEVRTVGQTLPAEKDKPQSSHEIATVETRTREPKRRAARLSNDWRLPRDWGEWAVSEGWHANAVREEAEKFRDYWISKSGIGATKLDWQATWRNWMRNSKTPKTNGGHHDRKRTEDPALANIARLAGLT